VVAKLMGAETALAGRHIQAQNFARFTFGDNLQRPAAHFAVGGESLKAGAGIHHDLDALAAIRAPNGFENFHPPTYRTTRFSQCRASDRKAVGGNTHPPCETSPRFEARSYSSAREVSPPSRLPNSAAARGYLTAPTCVRRCQLCVVGKLENWLRLNSGQPSALRRLNVVQKNDRNVKIRGLEIFFKQSG